MRDAKGKGIKSWEQFAILPDKTKGSEVVRSDQRVPCCATKVRDTEVKVGEHLVLPFEIDGLFLEKIWHTKCKLFCLVYSSRLMKPHPHYLH